MTENVFSGKAQDAFLKADAWLYYLLVRGIFEK